MDVADLLESYGWRGHFFATSDFVGARGFVSAAQLRDLRGRGHVIGSHSRSHPKRMSACTREKIEAEWSDSRAALEDMLSEAVTVASVPGGFYSRRVARAAVAAGIRFLFTSEPTTRSHDVDACRVIGRYTIYRGMAPESAGSLARGDVVARWRQAAMWNLKKLGKAVGGRAYLSAREKLLGGLQARLV
jgi:peptidoglycan/xylan/chitin deacetylase (PgdA/CDA1 family)